MAEQGSPAAQSLIRESALGLLAALHARGFHAAIVAGLLMMPAVAFVGFWTERPDHGPAADRQPLALRGTLDAARHPAPPVTNHS